jgi:hypothetical protein
MTVSETDYLIDACRYLLEEVRNAAVELRVVLPARQYVAMGGSVFDCEQVTVSGMSIQTGLVSPEGSGLDVIGPCPVTWNVTAEVAIVVCAHEAVSGPRGQSAPSVHDIEADSEAVSAGYGVIKRAVETIASSGQAGRVGCNVTLGQPQGGLIAVVATVQVNLWL